MGRQRTTSVALEPEQAFHFNSGDLEDGNDGKEIVGIGRGDGSWRLELYSALDVEVSGHSRDLELGNADKGISGGIGQGTGSWRIELTGNDDITVLAYIRTPDGFLTSMHDKVRGGSSDGVYRYEVPIFNPGSNRNQESMLRLVNEGNRTARVTISGKDDAGRPAAGGGTVVFSVPALAARTITAGQLESGDDLAGALGMDRASGG